MKIHNRFKTQRNMHCCYTISILSLYLALNQNVLQKAVPNSLAILYLCLLDYQNALFVLQLLVQQPNITTAACEICLKRFLPLQLGLGVFQQQLF